MPIANLMEAIPWLACLLSTCVKLPTAANSDTCLYVCNPLTLPMWLEHLFFLRSIYWAHISSAIALRGRAFKNPSVAALADGISVLIKEGPRVSPAPSTLWLRWGLCYLWSRELALTSHAGTLTLELPSLQTWEHALHTVIKDTAWVISPQ